jgi:hypothetical protein
MRHSFAIHQGRKRQSLKGFFHHAIFQLIQHIGYDHVLWRFEFQSQQFKAERVGTDQQQYQTNGTDHWTNQLLLLTRRQREFVIGIPVKGQVSSSWIKVNITARVVEVVAVVIALVSTTTTTTTTSVKLIVIVVAVQTLIFDYLGQDIGVQRRSLGG